MMNKYMGPCTGVALLAMSLSACVDAEVAIDVTGPSTAVLTVSQSMSADDYADFADDPEAAFCDDGQILVDVLVARCVMSTAGSFDQLLADEKVGKAIRITSEVADLVRVAYVMTSVESQFALGDSLDRETLVTLADTFVGKNLDLIIQGGEVVETNIEIHSGRAAVSLPIDSLLLGSVEVPAEYYAIMRR